MEAGGLELLGALLAAHAGNPGTLEQALGLLTNVTLRNPEAAEEVSFTQPIAALWPAVLGCESREPPSFFRPQVTACTVPITACRLRSAAAWMPCWN